MKWYANVFFKNCYILKKITFINFFNNKKGVIQLWTSINFIALLYAFANNVC